MDDAATRGFVRGTARDRGFEHVAKFLLLLGGDRAARVLARLAAAEVAGIVEEIARAGSIEQREARRILEEFGYAPDTRELCAYGGPAAAEAMLRAAFGEEHARIVPRLPPPQPPPARVASGEAEEEPGVALLEAEDEALRRALAERSDRQLACALAAAPAPVAQRLRACLAASRRAAIEAQAGYAAAALAAVQAGALRALVRQVVPRQHGEEN